MTLLAELPRQKIKYYCIITGVSMALKGCRWRHKAAAGAKRLPLAPKGCRRMAPDQR